MYIEAMQEKTVSGFRVKGGVIPFSLSGGKKTSVKMNGHFFVKENTR